VSRYSLDTPQQHFDNRLRDTTSDGTVGIVTAFQTEASEQVASNAAAFSNRVSERRIEAHARKTLTLQTSGRPCAATLSCAQVSIWISYSALFLRAGLENEYMPSTSAVLRALLRCSFAAGSLDAGVYFSRSVDAPSALEKPLSHVATLPSLKEYQSTPSCVAARLG
jgi:hypothetical protein